MTAPDPEDIVRSKPAERPRNRFKIIEQAHARESQARLHCSCVDHPSAVDVFASAVFDRTGDGQERRRDLIAPILPRNKRRNGLRQIGVVGDLEAIDRAKPGARVDREPNVGPADVSEQNWVVISRQF